MQFYIIFILNNLCHFKRVWEEIEMEYKSLGYGGWIYWHDPNPGFRGRGRKRPAMMRSR